jgi:hydroxymethylbilane synthase
LNRGEIRIGTRGSALALAQARLVAEAFERQGRRTRLVTVETEGDRRAPDTAWGEGAFVKAIERSLLRGAVDVAVHSAKDVPTDEDDRLVIGAYLQRADPRDALVVRADVEARRLADLPAGSRVGTDSPRRSGFVRALRPDLDVHPLHGNVDTRLRRLDAGETDALVLACAGLDRLHLEARIGERLDPAAVPPAPGQGAIAVQIRRDDARMLALAAAIDHRPTRAAVVAERAFLAASGGGCRAPIGALGEIVDGQLELMGAYVDVHGGSRAVARRRGSLVEATRLATALVHALRSEAVERADRTARARPHDLGASAGRSEARARPRVLVTRSERQAQPLMRALRSVGVDPIAVPTISIELESPARIRRLLGSAPYEWAVVTSPNGARAALAATDGDAAALSARWATVGQSTAAVLAAADTEPRFTPSRGTARSLADELPIDAGERVLVLRGSLADAGLVATLRDRGAEVDDVIVYRTREAPASSVPLLRRALRDGTVTAAIFTSGSTVRGLVALARRSGLDANGLHAICIGPETAVEADRNGFHVLAVSPETDARALARTAASALQGTGQA